MNRYIPFFYGSTSFFFKEKLHNIQRDVDYIYNNSFKELVDDIQKNTLKNKDYYLLSSNGDIALFNSSQLSSTDCVKAHEVNPINIYCGIYKRSSYSFGDDKEIIISINNAVLDLFFNQISIPDTTSKFRRLKNEITEKKIKASIAHELAHWVDDSIYKVFKKIVGDEKNLSKQRELLKLGTDLIDTTYFEIQAQIHGVAQIKNSFTKDEWDNFSVKDLFELYPPLADVIEIVYTKHDKQIALIWVRALLKRLNRERLLGKNMLTIFDIDELLESCLKPNIIYD